MIGNEGEGERRGVEGDKDGGNHKRAFDQTLRLGVRRHIRWRPVCSVGRSPTPVLLCKVPID